MSNQIIFEHKLATIEINQNKNVLFSKSQQSITIEYKIKIYSNGDIYFEKLDYTKSNENPPMVVNKLISKSYKPIPLSILDYYKKLIQHVRYNETEKIEVYMKKVNNLINILENLNNHILEYEQINQIDKEVITSFVKKNNISKHDSETLFKMVEQVPIPIPIPIPVPVPEKQKSFSLFSFSSKSEQKFINNQDTTNTINNKNTSLGTEINDLKNKLNKLEEANNTNIKLNEQNSVITKEIDTLRNKLSEMGTLSESNEQLKQQNKSLLEKNTILDSVNLSNVVLNQQNQLLNEKLVLLENSNQSNITLNQQNQLLNEKLKLLESVNENNTKLVEQNNLLSDKIIELENVKSENSKYVQQISVLNDKMKILDDLQITNIKLNKENNTNIEIIKNQMTRLSELESVYESNQKLKEQNSRLNDEINDLKLVNKKISNKLNDINEQYERLQIKLLAFENK